MQENFEDTNGVTRSRKTKNRLYDGQKKGNTLYLETGWEKPIDRRNRRCICLMYNVVNNSVPSYLTDILPPRISETTNYPLRNSKDFTIPSYRLTLTNSSFFPSTLRAWNSLDLENRNTPSYIN